MIKKILGVLLGLFLFVSPAYAGLNALRTLQDAAGTTYSAANTTTFFAEDWAELQNAIQLGTKGIFTQFVQVSSVTVDTLLTTNGMCIYRSDLNAVRCYINGAPASLISQPDIPTCSATGYLTKRIAGLPTCITIADTDLPTSQAGKTFTSTVTINNAAATDALASNAVTDPTCAAAHYSIWASSGNNAFKVCQNGTVYTLVGDSEVQSLSGKTIGDKLTFTTQGSDPACAAGNYWIYSNSATTTIRKCQNGTISDISSAVAASNPMVVTMGDSSTLVCSVAGTNTLFTAGTTRGSGIGTAFTPAPAAQTYKTMYVSLSNAVPAGETVVTTLQIAGVNTTVTCSIAAAGTTCNDSIHTASATAGQMIGYNVNCSGGTVGYGAIIISEVIN